eukprot:scaffold96961_cov52-Attheya_sp.AAC.3
MSATDNNLNDEGKKYINSAMNGGDGNDHVDDSERSPKELAKEGARARHRLLSIRKDVAFLEEVVRLHRELPPFPSSHDDDADDDALEESSSVWPVVSNERCGSWYAKKMASSSCYFKSTDGHVGTWNMSLKRLNVNFIQTVERHKSSGCLVVDATRRKRMPDAFSRTIPIWAAVFNRAVSHYRHEMGLVEESNYFWDTRLHTPPCVSEQERDQIEERLPELLQTLLDSGTITDPQNLVSIMKRPLRPFFITNNNKKREKHNTSTPNNNVDPPLQVELPDYVLERAAQYACIVCVSCSETKQSSAEAWRYGFCYHPGAADDHELWSRGLTPDLFGEHESFLLDESHTSDETDAAIDDIVSQAKKSDEEWYLGNVHQHFDTIGSSGISVGSRRAGRPPECWESFDAILNVTMSEYDGLQSGQEIPSSKRYLHVPVHEGKKDKLELEMWLPVMLTFAIVNVVAGKSVLIHCAQGRDRSVAVAMAFMALFCDIDYTTKGNTHRLSLQDWCLSMTLDQLTLQGNNDHDDPTSMYRHSGISATLVENLKGRSGRDLFFGWVLDRRKAGGKSLDDIDDNNDDDMPLATKQSLRIVLQLLQQQYREIASPTRTTLQKLHRFFMSGKHEEKQLSR